MDSKVWPYNLWADIVEGSLFGLPSEMDGRGSMPMLYVANLEEVMAAALNERQQTVIRMRYEQGATYKAIGEAIGIGSERVRQILVYSLRKFREPQFYHRLKAVPEIDVVQLKAENQKLVSQIESLKAHIQRVSGEADFHKRELQTLLPLDAPVDALGISIRSRNGLIAQGIMTVQDLLECKESTLRGFKKLGKVSIADIKNALAQYGYELKPD